MTETHIERITVQCLSQKKGRNIRKDRQRLTKGKIFSGEGIEELRVKTARLHENRNFCM